MRVKKWKTEGVTILLFVLGTRGDKWDRNSGDIDFSRELTGVAFDPFVSIEDIRYPIRYDVAQLQVLLEKVHTKFDRILIEILAFKTTSYNLIPVAVANMNGERSDDGTKNRQMKVIIKLRISTEKRIRTEAELRLEIEIIQNIADKANSIFPGTVEAIIWDEQNKLNNSFLTPFKIFYSHFQMCDSKNRHEGSIRPQFSYRVGISLHYARVKLLFAEFKKESNENNKILSMSKNFDIFYFKVFLEKMYSSNSNNMTTEAVKNTAILFEKVKTKFQKMAPTKEFGFHTWWPDTFDDGAASFSSLVQYWKEMDLLARKMKIQVIIEYAFDLPHKKSVMSKTSGWWRLVQSSEYRNSSDYVFEEKRCLRVAIPSDRILQTLNRTWLRQETHFNREFLATAFAPIPLKGQGSHIWTGQVVITEHITRHFSKLFCADQSIPFLIAKINAKNAAISADEKPMSVVLMFEKSTFDRTIKLAFDVNRIFPDTVKELHLQGYDDYLAIINNLHVPNGTSYKLGYGFNILRCNNLKFLSEKVVPSLSHFRVIYLNAHIDREYLKLGFDRISKYVTVLFDICRRNINKQIARVGGKGVEIALGTSWTSPTKSIPSDLDLVSVVKYVEYINEWAARTNTTVVLYAAFAHKGLEFESEELGGWWEVEQNGTSPELLFKSKKDALLERVLDEEAKVASTPKEENVITYVTIAIATISMLVAVAVSALYLKTRRGYLNKSDLNDFFDGMTDGGNSTFQDKAYNKEKYEVDKDRFTVEETSLLGSGAFGIVCRGTVSLEDGPTTEVAVKTTKVKCPRNALQGLLSEIKVLSHLGKHENVLELVGAYTAELRKGKVLAFLELAELGSLEGYLRKMKPGCDADTQEFLDINEVLKSDLVRWSAEIANGMEFIAEKYVVHLDIATRNVLLTADKTAKISDFGLSRRLENYQMYVKKQQECLPWKWMAPEALQRMEFTEKSDVWSFGVTLWEIFSLGDIPYPGLSWDINFASKLERGLRMERPAYTQLDMYTVMLSCWAPHPDRRPTFAELKVTIEEKKSLPEVCLHNSNYNAEEYENVESSQNTGVYIDTFNE